jgi:hypothetical protein
MALSYVPPLKTFALKYRIRFDRQATAFKKAIEVIYQALCVNWTTPSPTCHHYSSKTLDPKNF